MIDIGIKTIDRATALQFFVGLGLLVYVPASKSEPEALFWEPGIAYDDHPIAIVRKPAVFDEKTGEIVSEPEIDPAYHANIRLFGPNAEELAARIEKGGTVRNSLTLAKASDEQTAKTKTIANRTVSGVTMFRLGADGVKTPGRVWL